MRGVVLSDLDCSIARTLDVVGERWTMLVVRDAFNGIRRFEDFTASLPIARNVLTDRLNKLVDKGILQRARYQDRPPRFEYRLTAKGMDLYPLLVSLLEWGDHYAAGEDGPPVEILHRGCGGHVSTDVVCKICGEAITARAARAKRRTKAAVVAATVAAEN